MIYSHASHHLKENRYAPKAWIERMLNLNGKLKHKQRMIPITHEIRSQYILVAAARFNLKNHPLNNLKNRPLNNLNYQTVSKTLT